MAPLLKSKTTAVRKKLYINPDIQGGLIRRTVIGWSLFVATVLLIVSGIAISQNHNASILSFAGTVFSSIAPVLIASIILLPLFIYNQLKFSNRVVGPIYRMQREMKKLIEGGGGQKLRFRDGDHWPKLADDFNQLAELTIKTRRSLRNGNEGPTASSRNRNGQFKHLQMDLDRR